MKKLALSLSVLALAVPVGTAWSASPPPRHAVYSHVARDQSYARWMTLRQCMISEDGHGWICPLPAPKR